MKCLARPCLLLVLLPPLAIAQVYKWHDADGNTIYSQVPPPGGTPSETIHSRPTSGQATEAARERLDALKKRLEAQRKQRQEAAEKAKSSAIKRAALRQNCENARTALRELSYKTNPLIADGKGGYRRMTAEEHDAKVRELREKESKYCQ